MALRLSSTPHPGSSYRPLIYLATPYYHMEAEARQWRIDAARAVTRWMVENDHLVFCPIAYGSAWRGDLEWSHEQWMRFDLGFLDKADQLDVFCFPGWELSKGIREELIHCYKTDKQIIFHHWTDEFAAQLKIGPWKW